MILGVLGGLINRGAFWFSIYTPSSAQCTVQYTEPKRGWNWKIIQGDFFYWSLEYTLPLFLGRYVAVTSDWVCECVRCEVWGTCVQRQQRSSALVGLPQAVLLYTCLPFKLLTRIPYQTILCRAASMVGIPKISRYTNFIKYSVFLKLG